MRNNSSSSQIASSHYRRFFTIAFIGGVNNEVFFLFLIMIIIFFANLYCIIKNNVINTIYNILKRTFIRLMNSNIAFLKTSEIIDTFDKESDNSEKTKENKFNNQQMCYICLNTIELEVMAGCSHFFCGFYLFF